MTPEPRISRAARSIPPFLAMEVLERAQQLESEGADIVHLELGEPDFDVPECVRRAAEAAMREGRTHYTHSLGITVLREAIADAYQERYGVAVESGRIIITAGTSAGMCLLMAALLEPGDEVLLSNPRYPCYPNFVAAFNGVPISFPVSAANGFRYDPSEVRRRLTRRTAALLVNSPANPTGAIQPREVLAELAALGPPLISDEIYHGLEYGERAASVLEVTDHAFVLDGFSKRYAMTGWRLGWLVVPPEYVRPIQKLQQNLFICAGSVAQWAGVAALRQAGADVRRMQAEYAQRRRALLDGVRRLGFPVPGEPEGAYYVLADAHHVDRDSVRLAGRLLEEAGVAVTPGADFGPAAEGYLRFSFANALDRIAEGLRRLDAWLARRG
ncbi:MAG: pyridoxal phosphate-dependent aminotransferase [Armatimonadetes bacterium]|nr:pyridoxal phosphate-dependent aminotransferase [Armatimonadota bacterium]